jgi:hypothetical protein
MQNLYHKNYVCINLKKKNRTTLYTFLNAMQDTAFIIYFLNNARSDFKSFFLNKYGSISDAMSLNNYFVH